MRRQVRASSQPGRPASGAIARDVAGDSDARTYQPIHSSLHTKTYVWNARNQLTTVKTGTTTTASYAYDAFGRRTGTTLGGSATTLLNAGDTVVQEQQGGTPTANRLPGLGV